jgi:hypothetical protein
MLVDRDRTENRLDECEGADTVDGLHFPSREPTSQLSTSGCSHTAVGLQSTNFHQMRTNYLPRFICRCLKYSKPSIAAEHFML